MVITDIVTTPYYARLVTANCAKLLHELQIFSRTQKDDEIFANIAAEEVGLDENDMQSVVDGGKYTVEVAEQVRHAQQIVNIKDG